MSGMRLGITFTHEEGAWIRKWAIERLRGKTSRGIDDSIHHVEGEELNIIGIVGEILYARIFAVPWYQNPGKGGDHHRKGDLQLRDGSWLEVKASRNPRQMVVHHTTGNLWDLAAFVWWNEKKRTGYPMGIITRGRLQEVGERKLVTNRWGRKVTVSTIGTGDLHASEPLAARTLKLQRPQWFRGAMCPWCLEATPCGKVECRRCLLIREGRREIVRDRGPDRRDPEPVRGSGNGRDHGSSLH